MIQAITLLVIAALVAIDQIIKVAVVNRFAAGGSMDILFGLIRIRYVENTGAAFSSMQNQTVFLTIFTAVVIVMFIFLLMTKKIKPGFIYWCVAVIIAGGAGNFVDRVAVSPWPSKRAESRSRSAWTRKRSPISSSAWSACAKSIRGRAICERSWTSPLPRATASVCR